MRKSSIHNEWTRSSFILLLAGSLAVGAAQEQPMEANPTHDKSRYHLLNPTPRKYMREMSTDRPDLTESPYTVDAGHFQVEMDFINAVFDRDRSSGGDLRTTGFATPALNLKAGLLHNVDLQLVLEPYVWTKVEDRVARTVDRDSGFGDMQTRLKINLWGNDGGTTALGLMPFIKWPLPESSLRNGKTEGGLLVPLAVQLPGDWGMGVMSEFDFVSDGSGGYDAEYFNTITFGHDVIGKLGGYVEFASLVAPESDREWQGQIGVGFTYGVNENTQFDGGCNFGVTRSAPDFNPFIGLSYRF